LSLEIHKYKNSLSEHISLFNMLIDLEDQFDLIAQEIYSTLKRGNKILIAGNGGSATDSQHFAAELVGRFEKKRLPLPAIDLTSNCSSITSISNDFDYEEVFSRQIQALGQCSDIFLGISTSGNSRNILRATEVSKQIQIKTLALVGNDGGELFKNADISLVIPSNRTARIQEAHIFILHSLCEFIDNLFC